MSSYTSGVCCKYLHISFNILLQIVSFQFLTKAVQPETSFAENFKNLHFIPLTSNRSEIKILTPIMTESYRCTTFERPTVFVLRPKL